MIEAPPKDTPGKKTPAELGEITTLETGYMHSTKPWYLSKGFLGPLVTVILLILRHTGVVDLPQDSVENFLYMGVELFGGALGLYGRAVAKDRITPLGQK